MRQWVLFDMPDHGGYYHLFDTPDGERSMGRGAHPAARPHRADHRRRSTSSTSTTAAAGCERGSVHAHRRRGRRAAYELDDLGWVYCQGGGYFGGFDDGLGQGVYRGDYHVEGEVWDVTPPDATSSAPTA